GTFFSVFFSGCKFELCSPSVVASRNKMFIPQSQNVSLSCDIHHCEDLGWKGGWGRHMENKFTLLSSTPRHLLYNRTLNHQHTTLHMTILNTSFLDSGMYQCRISWTNGQSSNGHITYINITEAIPKTGRKMLTRMLLCSGAVLCLPLVLGILHCLSPNDTPTPDVTNAKLKTEVVYAALALEAAGRMSGRQPPPSTIYSSLQFPRQDTC
ncbi:hypothetical protein GN956_G8026, partial [Arapaima gigas]